MSVQAALPHLRPDGSVTIVTAASARAADRRQGGLRTAANGALETMIAPLAAERDTPLCGERGPSGVIDTHWRYGMP